MACKNVTLTGFHGNDLVTAGEVQKNNITDFGNDAGKAPRGVSKFDVGSP
jgi:hypothetical protein